jgi:hypothetical protein
MKRLREFLYRPTRCSVALGVPAMMLLYNQPAFSTSLYR